MSITKLDWLTISTAFLEYTGARAGSEQAKANRTAAKDELTEATEAMEATQEELSAKYTGTAAPEGADARLILTQCKDVAAARQRMELADRKHRQATHHAAEMLERLEHVMGEISGRDGTLPFDSAQANDPNAYGKVLLRNLIGELQAMAFEKAGIATVGDAIAVLVSTGFGPRVSAGEFTAEQAEFLHIKVVDLLNRLGIQHTITPPPAGTRERYAIAPPEVPKAAKNTGPANLAQESIEDDEEDDEEDTGSLPEGASDWAKSTAERMVELFPGVKFLGPAEPGLVATTPLAHRGDFAADPAADVLRTSFLSLYTGDEGLRKSVREATRAFNTAETFRSLQQMMQDIDAPTVGALAEKLEKSFGQKKPRDVRADFEPISEGQLDAIGEILAVTMNRTGSPVLYALCDTLIARHEAVFDELFGHSALGKIARRPEEERYARVEKQKRTKKKKTG